MTGFLGDCSPNYNKYTHEHYWVYPNQKILKCEDFAPVFEECIAVNGGTINCHTNCEVTMDTIHYVTVEAIKWDFIFPEYAVPGYEQTVILKVEYEATVHFYDYKCEPIKRVFEVCHELAVCCDLTECEKNRFDFEANGPQSTYVLGVISVPECADLKVIKFTTTDTTPLGTVQGIKCCDIAVPAVNVSTECMSDNNTPAPANGGTETDASDGSEEE